MSRHHLVRVGALGHVGRFTAVDAVRYPRGARVVVRTSRGLELGEILAPTQATGDATIERGTTDGSILRGVTVEDQLLEARLDRNKQAAFDACVAQLSQLGSDAVLLDVEQLFDGRSLFFYFLGEVTPAIEALIHQLSETYDSVVQVRKFAETMAAGCGPECGTEAAVGGGCTTCAVGCAVSGACGTKKR